MAAKKKRKAIRTLANIGLTPARAWALHQIGFRMMCDKNDRKTEFKRENEIMAGYRRGLVRVLHHSFGLIVFYVPERLPEPLDDEGELTGNVIAIAVGAEGRAEWRQIGYVHEPLGHFVDILDINGENAPFTVDHSLDEHAERREGYLAMETKTANEGKAA
jgi:hypothetical protein